MASRGTQVPSSTAEYSRVQSSTPEYPSTAMVARAYHVIVAQQVPAGVVHVNRAILLVAKRT